MPEIEKKQMTKFQLFLLHVLALLTGLIVIASLRSFSISRVNWSDLEGEWRESSGNVFVGVQTIGDGYYLKWRKVAAEYGIEGYGYAIGSTFFAGVSIHKNDIQGFLTLRCNKDEQIFEKKVRAKILLSKNMEALRIELAWPESCALGDKRDAIYLTKVSD